MTAPSRRWSYSLRTLFVAVTLAAIASVGVLVRIQAVKVSALQMKVDALEAQNTAFREMLRTRPPLTFNPNASPPEPRPSAH